MASFNKYALLLLALLQCSLANLDDPICFKRQHFDDGTSIFIKMQCNKIVESIDSKKFDSLDDFSLQELLNALVLPFNQHIPATTSTLTSCTSNIAGVRGTSHPFTTLPTTIGLTSQGTLGLTSVEMTTNEMSSTDLSTLGNEPAEQTTNEITTGVKKTTTFTTQGNKPIPTSTEKTTLNRMTTKSSTQNNEETTIGTTIETVETTQQSTKSDTTTNSPTTIHFTTEAHAETTESLTTIYSTTETNAETTGPALCNEIFYNDSSPVTSLNYPANYPDDLDCEYKIIASTENVIRIDFVAFEVEPDLACDKDYVEIFEETPAKVALTGKLCGDSIPSTVVSTGHQVIIAFHSDSTDNRAGFRADIHFLSSPSCGVTYMNENSVITSPNYPNKYDNNEACHNWIVAPLGKTIQLTFTDFDLEVEHLNGFPSYVAVDWSEWEGVETTPTEPKLCNFDFLRVYDGENSSNDLILMSHLCGKTPPPPLLTTGNKMYIYFESDAAFTFRGYRATYQFL